MKCSLKKMSDPAGAAGDCLALFLPKNARRLPPGAAALDKAAGGVLRSLLKDGDFSAAFETSLLLARAPQGIAARRLLLLGAGDKPLSEQEFIRMLQKGLQKLMSTPAQRACLWLEKLEVQGRKRDWQLQQVGRITLHLAYRYRKTLKKPRSETRLKELVIAVPDAVRNPERRALQRGMAVANGANLARELGNLPANICTPRFLADQGRTLARKYPGLKASILDEARMRALKMGALLSVARGSREPPRLIALEYRGGPAKRPPIVLIGKGVTFDTGGISIKPSVAMDEMKFDMCGAASVFGAVQATAELGLPLNVVGLVGAVENMPGGSATKPGDVVRAMSGRTVEVLNTDAEGRLVLCDVLHYAQRQYKPECMIDAATLTGACVIALGSEACGLYSNRPELAQALCRAGETAGDRAWQMPLWKEYQRHLKSNFADVANIGGGREAGSITAACFLARFVEDDCPWAHLDIAGTAWHGGGPNKGATGRPVPLLMQFLFERADRKS